jgi:hypothetical protein
MIELRRHERRRRKRTNGLCGNNSHEVEIITGCPCNLLGYYYIGSQQISQRMDYLRTLGSAAVSTLVQKSGLTLPFSLGPKVTAYEGIWTLYDATKRVRFPPIPIHDTLKQRLGRWQPHIRL